MRAGSGRRTVLFLDEVHRFNKSQQDAFLPYVEDGTVCFIGATTENPSFEINSALLSRARVYVLRSLTADDIQQVLRRALEREFSRRRRGRQGRRRRDRHAGPRGRRRCAPRAEPARGRRGSGARRRAARITEEIAGEVSAGGYRRFDKKGEQFYDQISALHKAVRGTDPDAALYWLCRMLDGGCDPRYVCAARDPHGLRRHRQCRSARAAAGARGGRGLRAARQPGRRTRAGPGRRVHGRRGQEQCGLRGLQGGHGRRAEARHARRAHAPAQCADQADEGPGLRRGLSLRARRARGLCGGREVFPGRDGAGALLRAGAARARDQDRRGAASGSGR